MKSLVIIPTYNEKENIEKMIKQVCELGFTVLVIDDNSPDGTGELIEKLQIIPPWRDKLQIIHRKAKLGLGTAYIQGFKWALSRDFNYIFTMDADFSHNPECLAEFQTCLMKTGFDLIIGSRYVPGGGNSMPVQRKIISRCGNFYAKTILNFPVNDCTSGFMGFRRQALEKINFDEVKSEGYGFLIEMKYRTHKLGYKIFECPIFFADRAMGKSKISKNIIWEAIFLVWKLKMTLKVSP